MVGETAEARKWLTENSLNHDLTTLKRSIEGAIKQEEALDEVGAYNYMNNPNMDVALKGVHDMFDYSELGVRTVDDFGMLVPLSTRCLHVTLIVSMVVWVTSSKPLLSTVYNHLKTLTKLLWVC